MAENGERRKFLAHAVQGVAAAACGGVAWNALLVQQVHAVPFALRPPGAQRRARLRRHVREVRRRAWWPARTAR